MLGTPNNDFETKQSGSETITGGASQRNDAHYIELLCAFAAYDFFTTPHDKLEDIRTDKKEVQYFFRSLNDNGRIDFKDFVPAEKVKEFAKKFGILVAMSFLVYPDFTDFYAAAQAGTLAKNNITGYDDIAPAEVAALKKYFQFFHFGIDSEGNLTDGWLRQMHRSANGQDKFLFHAGLFSIGNNGELKKFKFNKDIYRPDEQDVDSYEYGTKLFGSPYDSFKDEFVKRSDDPSITNKSEKLIKRMYQTLESLYKF